MKQKIIYITYKGERKTIRKWAETLDVSWRAIYQRIVRRGWSVTRAMETPFQKNAKTFQEGCSTGRKSDIEVVEFTDTND